MVLSDERPDLTCAMGQVWPPIQIKVFGSVEGARPHVDPATYDRLRVWDRACGLTAMEPERCLTCRHVIKDGVPVHQDEKHAASPAARSRDIAKRIAR